MQAKIGNPPAPPKADALGHFDAFPHGRRALHKGGHPFGIGVGPTGDKNVPTPRARSSTFSAAMLVDAKGNITGEERSGPARRSTIPAADGLPCRRMPVPWDDSFEHKFPDSGQGGD